MSRNDTAAPRRRSGKSRRPFSTSFRPERAKEDTAGEAQLTNSCRRAHLGALPARCNTFAVSEPIFVARPFRGCFVLNSLNPAVGFLDLACSFPFSIRSSRFHDEEIEDLDESEEELDESEEALDASEEDLDVLPEKYG